MKSVLEPRAQMLEFLDGVGAADHDVACVLGRTPRALTPFSLSPRQLARVLGLCSRVRYGLLSGDTRR